MALVTPSPVPAGSALQERLKTSYFHDSYQLQLPDDGSSAMALYLRCVARTPGWIDQLMRLRNRMVAPFGIKDLGTLSGVDPAKQAHSYRVGERAGIFRIDALSDGEVVLGDRDRHLDVQVSVMKLPRPGGLTVAMSTVVHVHNALGRIYMLGVVPAHRIIAPSVTAKMAG
ncbi:MAG: DUF2867 domain-containing protein [Burkholderiaceae bacterium]|jgi:hypothetical protein|nr:DUF2867 domain-containing protein [Burkholderiaceae bacterium]